MYSTDTRAIYNLLAPTRTALNIVHSIIRVSGVTNVVITVKRTESKSNRINPSEMIQNFLRTCRQTAHEDDAVQAARPPGALTGC